MPDFRAMFAAEQPQDFRSMFGTEQPEKPQRNYAWSEVPGAAASNLAENAGTVGGHLVEAASNPIETLKGLGKLAIGTVQQFVPGQQQYEAEYSDPFYARLFNDAGVTFGENGMGFDQEQLKRTLAERPVEAMLDVSMVAGAPGAVVGRFPGAVGSVGRGLETVSRATNPLHLPTRAVTSVARRAISPFPARQANAAANAALQAEGVRLTAGQATGSKGLRYAESELGGARTGDAIDLQNAQFTRAASHRIGEDTPHLDGQTMDGAYHRIGGEIGSIAQRNTVVADRALVADVGQAVQGYNRLVPPTLRAPIVSQVAQHIQGLTAGLQSMGRIPGDVYQSLRAQLGAEARSAARDPNLQRALYGLQHALDDAMDRNLRASGNSADIAAFRTARRQYRNYLVLENAMATGGAETAAGVLTPARLEQAAASGHGKRAYLHGHSDFTTLAKAGKVGMTKMPESGTSSRNWMRAVPAALGGAIGGTMGGLEAAAGAAAGVAAPAVAGRVLMSRFLQAYLRNQAAGRIPRLPRAIGTGATVGVSASQRLEDMKDR